MQRVFLLVLGSMFFMACGRQPIERFAKVENKTWAYNAPQQFLVDIKEPGQYRMFVQFRYNQDYTYNNIWVGLTEKKPDGTEEKTRFNIPLFDLQGRPYGSFAGRFFDRSYPDAEVDGQNLSLSFPQAGIYTLTLQHNMRLNDLAGISEVGIRLKAVK